MADKTLKITLRKSAIGFDRKQKLVVQGLGLLVLDLTFASILARLV